MAETKTKFDSAASINVPGKGHRNHFAEVQHAENVGATLKRILRYFAQEKLMLLAMLAVVIVSTLCGVYAPTLQSRSIDIIAGTETGILKKTLILMVIIYVIYGLGQLGQTLLSSVLSQRIVRRLREELFNRFIDLPVRYPDTHSHGDMMSRMTNDIENISTTVSQSLPSFFSGVLTILGTVAIMVWYCWQLALLSCFTVILTVISTKYVSKLVRKYSRSRQAYLGQLNGTVEEMISGYQTLTAYSRQDATIDSFNVTSDELTKASIKADALSGCMGPIMNCISNIGFVIIAIFGGIFSIHGLITVGVISAFIVYAKQFSRPINQIAQVYGQLQTAVACAERVFRVLDEPVEDMSGENLCEDGAADVIFKNVCFSYVPGTQVLRNFSMTVPAGKKVALVGATGSGKTTVVNMLERFYDLDSGNIYINEQDIASVGRGSLRKDIAIVLQDTTLFTDSIRNNLLYGNENADAAALSHALEMSRCQAFIDALPDGLDTVLTGAGSNLSQGQRQLLAIARAFVADPRILILDEATSSVDTRTEKAIQDAMQRIMQSRTSIVIAHRLSTIRDADMIVVMDHGQIVEQGSHDDLLEKRGRYYDLYMTQYAGFAT